VEPVGDEVIFDIIPTEIAVKGIGSSNELIMKCALDCATGYTGRIALSMEQFGKLLPKGIEEVDIDFGQETHISATGYKASIRPVNEVGIRIPKKEVPIDEVPSILVNPQQFYEKLDALKKAFDGQSFTLTLDPDKPGLIEFGDFDSSVGSMTNSLVTTVPIEEKVMQIYPYETVMPCLNAVRIPSQQCSIRFAKLPAAQGALALCIAGVFMPAEGYMIQYLYVLAPRVGKE